MQDLLEMQRQAGNSLEFIEHVKTDLFPDEIYVFTPKGTIMELPAGSTAVDFAYAVHTDVGNSCVACRINRTLAPLSQPLQSGQTVEIIASGTQPNPAWLGFVITGKARSNIRHYLKNQRRSEAISLGRRLLNKTLSSFGFHLSNIPKEKVGGFYLGSIGGPAARLAQDCIKKVEVLDYEELGMEAIWKIEVENFPAFLIIDDKGNDFYAQTRKPLSIGKKPN